MALSRVFLLLSVQLWVVVAQIRIQSPSDLVNHLFTRQSQPGYIQGSTATFGAPYYGQRVIGRIMYGPSLKDEDYCTPEDYDIPSVDASGKSHFGEGEGGELKATGEGEFTDRPQINIVIVKRGASKCRFTTKVSVAEKHKNAHAVIIVDKEDNKDKDVTRLIMADENNYGTDIKIPSILVNYADGEKLIQAIQTHGLSQPLIAELVWDIPVNNIVNMDIWMSVSSREANEFLKGFKETGEALAYNLRVEPHYHIFSVPSGQDYDQMCTDTSGRFCAEPPVGGGAITGKEVAIESVRQLCIHDITAIKDPEHPLSGDRSRSWEWWEYVTAYHEFCPIHSDDLYKRFGAERCSEDLMRAKGIDVDSVRKCMTDTLEEKLVEQKRNTAWSKYAVRINGWRFAGQIEPDGITRAICAAYVQPVPECGDLVVGHSKLGSGMLGMSTNSGITTLNFLLLIVVIVLCLSFAMVLYKRLFLSKYIQKALREEVMLEVQSQLADYVPLEDVPGPNGNRNIRMAKF